MFLWVKQSGTVISVIWSKFWGGEGADCGRTKNLYKVKRHYCSLSEISEGKLPLPDYAYGTVAPRID